MSLISQNKKLETLLLPITLSKIPSRDISLEFKILNELTTTQSHLKSLVQDPQYASLNRYSDVLPYRHNQILTSHSAVSPNNYINANLISNPHIEGRLSDFIATQGPLERTSETFWNLVSFTEAPIIICIVENNALGSRCWQYWPSKNSLQLGNWKIEIVAQEPSSFFNKSTLLNQDKLHNKKQVLQHFHIYQWLDHQAFEDDFFVNYLSLLELVWNYKQQEKTKPIVVHCSAGIGRTGTFIASYFLYEQFKKAKLESNEFCFSVFGVVRHLKEQRYGAVQTFKQYQLLYQLVKHFK